MKYGFVLLPAVLGLVSCSSKAVVRGTLQIDWPGPGAVAVLPFANIEAGRRGDEVAAIAFETGFSTCERYPLVERRKLTQIIEEMDLQADGYFSETRAAEIGKLLGARYLILGTVSSFQGRSSVSIRCVEVETAKVIFLKQVEKKDIQGGAAILGEMVSGCSGRD